MSKISTSHLRPRRDPLLGTKAPKKWQRRPSWLTERSCDQLAGSDITSRMGDVTPGWKCHKCTSPRLDCQQVGSDDKSVMRDAHYWFHVDMFAMLQNYDFVCIRMFEVIEHKMLSKTSLLLSWNDVSSE